MEVIISSETSALRISTSCKTAFFKEDIVVGYNILISA
jgi:hypothetical protein